MMEHGLLEAEEDGHFGSCDEAAKQISVVCGQAAEAVLTMKLCALDGKEHGNTIGSCHAEPACRATTVAPNPQ